MKEKTNPSSQTIRQCDIFISYRREGGDMTAMYFYQALKERGYNVFYDLEVLRAGKFNEALLSSIQSCKDFVLILSPHALDRCGEADDWVRREIAEALRCHKNIVPVMMKGFEFPEKLPDDIDDVRYQNGLTSTTEYFAESIDRLCQRYLNSTPAVEKKKKSPLAPVAIAAAVVALGVGGFLALRGGKQAPAPAPVATVEATAEVTAEPTAEPTAEITAEPTAEITAEPAAEVTAEPTAEPTSEPAAANAAPAAVSNLVQDTDFPALSSAIDRLAADDDSAPEDTFQQVRQESPVLGHPTLRRMDVASVTFLPSLEGAPQDAWDVSEAGDGRVLAWITPNGELFDLTIAGDGGVKLVDCDDGSRLFCGFCNAESIDFNGCVDASERTNWFRAFSSCFNLKRVNLAGVCGESAVIAAGMFENCRALEEVDLSGFAGSELEDMNAMFLDCESLKALDFTGFNTAEVVNMSAMFAGCQGLETLVISGFDTAKVTDMANMFENCNRLKALDVSGFDTGRVKDMTRMFAECQSLEALDVSHFNTARVTGMGDLFCDCKQLKALDVSGFDTSRVRDMRGMFVDCHSLETLDVAGFNTASVENMSNMFWACERLDGLDPSGWDTGRVQNMDHMFTGCGSLYRLDLSHWNTSAVTSMTQMFCSCNYAVEILVTDWDVSAVEKMDGLFQGDAELESIGRDPKTFGHGDTLDMYDGCDKLGVE